MTSVPGLGVVEDAALADEDVLHVGAVGHHDGDDVDVLDRLGDRAGGAAARVDEGLGLVGVEVVADDVVAGVLRGGRPSGCP